MNKSEFIECERDIGLAGDEAIEMAYENVKAKRAIKGVRKSKEL